MKKLLNCLYPLQLTYTLLSTSSLYFGTNFLNNNPKAPYLNLLNDHQWPFMLLLLAATP